MKIGFITIGQSPRDDVMCDMEPLLGPTAEIMQSGALDDLSLNDVLAFEPPQRGEYIMVTKMRDGSSVRFAENRILPHMQQRIEEMELNGASLIVILCTGEFPVQFRSSVPVIYPSLLLRGVMQALCRKANLLVLTPDSSQLRQAIPQWSHCAKQVNALALSPFSYAEEIENVALAAKALPADLAVMDCISFGREAQLEFQKLWGKPVLLSRTLLARIIAELAG